VGSAHEHEVWIDQDLCTGDGLCVQEASNVFEFDIDGLAYVKNADGDLLTAPGARAPVQAADLDAVILSARKCPGACIHVVRVSDGVEVAGPDAD
jgi:ferredoxin